MFTRISIKTVPDTSLHETSDLIQAIEFYQVETTFMLKAVKKNYHYNKKKKTLQYQGRYESVVGEINPLAPELFFLILAHPVYKM